MPLNTAPLIFPALIEKAPAWERYVSAGMPYVFAVAAAMAVWSIWSILTHGKQPGSRKTI